MVRGRVVLNIAQDPFHGLRLVIVEPVTAANLAAGNGLGGGTPLVAADLLLTYGNYLGDQTTS